MESRQSWMGVLMIGYKVTKKKEETCNGKKGHALTKSTKETKVDNLDTMDQLNNEEATEGDSWTDRVQATF